MKSWPAARPGRSQRRREEERNKTNAMDVNGVRVRGCGVREREHIVSGRTTRESRIGQDRVCEPGTDGGWVYTERGEK